MDAKKKITLVVALLTLFLSGCAQSIDFTPFAQCLTDNGAVMYGAYWCPHCQDQKKMFGPAFEKIKYVECDPKGKNANPQLCEKKGVQRYPTWEFKDGKIEAGVLELIELSQKTSCPLPSLPVDDSATTK